MKKAKIWDKTSIIWGFDNVSHGVTNIPVDDWHDVSQKHFYSVTGLRIVSLSDPIDRQAMIELNILRCAIAPTTARSEIIQRLMNLDKSITGVKSEDYSQVFSVTYKLGNGESFCDSALAKAKLILEKFGIEDGKGYRLANFLVFRESLVYTSTKGWIPFSDYLRHKHGLEQACSLWGQALKIGNLVFAMSYKGAESNFLNR